MFVLDITYVFKYALHALTCVLTLLLRRTIYKQLHVYSVEQAVSSFYWNVIYLNKHKSKEIRRS